MSNGKTPTEVRSIPISAIIRESNPRRHFDQKALEDLAANIKATRLLQPITVRKKGEAYILIAGERRLRAFIINGEEFIDAIIYNVEELDPELISAMRLTENIQRENLSDLEVALALKQIKLEKTYTNAQLGQIFGFSESWAKQKIYHADLAEALLQDGRVDSLELLAKVPTKTILEFKPQLKHGSGPVLDFLLPQLEEGVVPKREEAASFAKNPDREPSLVQGLPLSPVEKLEAKIHKDEELLQVITDRLTENRSKLEVLRGSEAPRKQA